LLSNANDYINLATEIFYDRKSIALLNEDAGTDNLKAAVVSNKKGC
jgi:hypothetical protein